MSVSDEALLAILKKVLSIAKLMEESAELEIIQSSKPQIIVDSGFASNLTRHIRKVKRICN